MAPNDNQSRGHAHLDGGDQGEGRSGDGHCRSIQKIPYQIRVGENNQLMLVLNMENLIIDQDIEDNHNNSPEQLTNKTAKQQIKRQN